MSKKESNPETGNIQAVSSKKGKPQHMVPGKVYAVGEEVAKTLMKKGSAIKAQESHKPGNIYDIPKRKAD